MSSTTSTSLCCKLNLCTLRGLYCSIQWIRLCLFCQPRNPTHGEYETIHLDCFDICLDNRPRSEVSRSTVQQTSNPSTSTIHVWLLICKLSQYLLIFLQNALFPYQAKFTDELTFDLNDEVMVLEKPDGGWWLGKCHDVVGWFPFNFVDQVGRPVYRPRSTYSLKRASSIVKPPTLQTTKCVITKHYPITY